MLDIPVVRRSLKLCIPLGAVAGLAAMALITHYAYPHGLPPDPPDMPQCVREEGLAIILVVYAFAAAAGSVVGALVGAVIGITADRVRRDRLAQTDRKEPPPRS